MNFPPPICKVCQRPLVHMGVGMFSQWYCTYEKDDQHQRAYWRDYEAQLAKQRTKAAEAG